MKKKILIGLGIVAIAVLAIFGLQALLPSNEAQVGNKQLNIVVIDTTDGNKELFNDTIKTDAETLGDVHMEDIFKRYVVLNKDLKKLDHGGYMNQIIMNHVKHKECVWVSMILSLKMVTILHSI